MGLDIKEAIQAAVALLGSASFKSEEHRQQCCQLALLGQRQVGVEVEITQSAVAAFEKLKQPAKKADFVRFCTAVVLLSAALALPDGEFPVVKGRSKDDVNQAVLDSFQAAGVPLVADRKLADRVIADMAARAKTDEEAARVAAQKIKVKEQAKVKSFAAAVAATKPTSTSVSASTPKQLVVAESKPMIHDPTKYVFIPRDKFCYRSAPCQHFWGTEGRCRFDTQCRYLHRSYWLLRDAARGVYWLVTPIADRPPACPPFIEIETVAADDMKRRQVLDALVSSARNVKLFTEFAHEIAEHLEQQA